jgi:HK97 family phage prohead protease
MEKILHIASTFKSHENDDGSVMIRGMASTNHSDRAGDVISKEAWEKGGLENFKNNPVILFNHDYDKPIGRATGVKVTENGLELEAKISKSAPAAVCELVKDGVLGAFSVGFRVKDADYIKETDGLMIKDAELFEVSVVSVPCNQAATFSLAKSFDSQEEYNEFKKTFTNRVDLTGQSLTKEDEISSNLVSDAPTSSEKSEKQEIKMDTKESGIDLEAFAKKVAEETAAKIAMKQAEQKAADNAEAKIAADAAAAKSAQDEQVKSVITSGIESGVERLEADMKADFEKAKGDEINELMKKYEADVAEKSAELEAMRNSKMEFAREGKHSVKDFGQEAFQAEVLGKITGKGWDTDFARDLKQKVGAIAPGSQPTSIGDFSVAYTDAFEKAVTLETRLGGLYREVPMQSNTLVVPFLDDVNSAAFGTIGGLSAAANSLESPVGQTDEQLDIGNRILIAERLVAGTYIDNNVDEGQLISFLPMINASIARAHGKAIDEAILYGTSNNTVGILDDGGDKTIAIGNYAGTGTKFDTTAQQDGSPAFTSLIAQTARGQMGNFGINPSNLAYVVNTDTYYDLLSDGEFHDITDVGSDLASKITGQVGTIFGSPVIVSDLIPNGSGSDAKAFGAVINTQSALIGRLRGVSLETDYEAANQRTGIIASQSLAFKQIQGATSNIAMYYTANGG